MATAGIIIIFLFSLINIGILNRVKNFLAGRRGQPVMQGFYDMVKNLGKGSVYSIHTSPIFRIAPLINLACIASVTLFIPFSEYGAIISFSGDIFVFAYILALGRFFMMLAAMDTGSAFEGMGTVREALYSTLIEPVFFLLLGSLALLTGQSSLSNLILSFNPANSFEIWLSVFTGTCFFVISLVENKRLPVDDPKTHLELTMIHEVMVLDHSGFELGIIQFTSGLKSALYGAIIGVLVIPHHLPLWLEIICYCVLQMLVMAASAVVESVMARFRMNRNPRFILSLVGFGFIAMILALVIKSV